MNFDAMELTGGDLYFKTSDGEWQYLTSLTGVETYSAETSYYPTQPNVLWPSAEFSGRSRFMKLGRCKTRKRLVKLLMSKIDPAAFMFIADVREVLGDFCQNFLANKSDHYI